VAVLEQSPSTGEALVRSVGGRNPASGAAGTTLPDHRQHQGW
jgi:hypothetical protein